MNEQELLERKAAVIADECRFQRACGNLVERGVIYCVSSLMYDIGQNLEKSAEIFDVDYDEAIGWFEREDYQEPVEEFIRNDADLDQLEWIADEVGYWSDVTDGLGYATYLDDFTPTPEQEEALDLEDWLKLPANAGKEEALREAVIELITNSDEYREVANKFDIEPERVEVYEHWLCCRDFANLLESVGETVFDFCDFTIWGRTTTGQSISMDYCIKQIVKGLPNDHWVWHD